MTGIKRATVNADGKVQQPKLTTAERLATALRYAHACEERLANGTLTGTAQEMWADSRREHLRDAARLQKKLDKELAANG